MESQSSKRSTSIGAERSSSNPRRSRTAISRPRGAAGAKTQRWRHRQGTECRVGPRRRRRQLRFAAIPTSPPRLRHLNRWQRSCPLRPSTCIRSSGHALRSGNSRRYSARAIVAMRTLIGHAQGRDHRLSVSRSVPTLHRLPFHAVRTPRLLIHASAGKYHRQHREDPQADVEEQTSAASSCIHDDADTVLSDSSRGAARYCTGGWFRVRVRTLAQASSRFHVGLQPKPCQRL